jgi:hypothetical protein
MRKFALTTAIAVVLAAGSAYAADHHGGGSGGGGFGGAAVSGGAHAGGSGGGTAINGGGHMSGGGGPRQSMMSRGPSGQSGFGHSEHLGSSHNGSQFSRMDREPQGRTASNQEHGNRSLYNRYNDRDRDHGGFDRDHDHDRFSRDRDYERFDRDHDRFSRDRDFKRFGRDRDRDMDFRHRGVVRGNFFEHGRRFGFRRFWHNEWVYLTDWDSCTAWAWVHVAPGLWAWRPIDVCIG